MVSGFELYPRWVPLLVNFFFGYFYFLSRGKGTFCQTEEICANQRAEK